jgi:hypothetical protein
MLTKNGKLVGLLTYELAVFEEIFYWRKVVSVKGQGALYNVLA